MCYRRKGERQLSGELFKRRSVRRAPTIHVVKKKIPEKT